MHHCPIPLSMSPAHFRLEVHRARDCPGSCEGIAHGMAHRANNSAQTKHKQNKPAMTATILRNLPTTHSRAAPSAQTQHKQNKQATTATIVRNLPPHPQKRAQPADNNKTNNRPGNGRNDYAEFSHDGWPNPSEKKRLKNLVL